MTKILAYERKVLSAYMKLPASKLLSSILESEGDYIAGYVSRFIAGERFNIEFIAFSKEELDIINPIISKNISTDDGKDLLSRFLLIKLVCNILNKYRTYN